MNNTDSILAWYVVHTRPKCEHIAASLIAKSHRVETYCPRIRFQRTTRRGKVWFVEALFPAYFFARFTPNESLSAVMLTQSVINVVDFGASLTRVPDRVIADLKAEMDGQEVRVVEIGDKAVDVVEQSEVSRRGLQGIVNDMLSGANRVRILLEFLRRESALVSSPRQAPLSPPSPVSPSSLIPHFPPVWADVFGEDDCGIFAECEVSGVRFAWRWICPGKFQMGSPEDEKGRYEDEGPLHEVILTRGFWLGETPVTQAQWQAVMEGNPSRFRGDQRPVESVDWHQSVAFANKLNELLPGLHAALPTEAQWEYACRAGTQAAYHDGSPCTEPSGLDPALDKLGWFDKNSGGQTHEVKRKDANAWGLYDMHGNVWEWCRDAWDEQAYAKRHDGIENPETVDEDKSALRVVRGGSWDNQAQNCRAAIRRRDRPGNDWNARGLRLSAGHEPRAAEPLEMERSDLP